MNSNTHSQTWPHWSFGTLLVSLLMLLLISPFFEGVILQKALRALFTFVILTAIYTLSKHTVTFWIALALLIPASILNWFTIEHHQEWEILLAYIFNISFFALLFSVLFYNVFFTKQYEYDLLFGAISIYLLLGIFWALLYSFFHTLDPDSFKGVLAPHTGYLDNEFQTFLYFSFVTLTTLGYGDITPVFQHVKNLAILEAIVGQFYIATLVAGLVSTLTWQRRSKSNE